MSVSSIEVQPLKKPLDIVVTVPGSKSYTSRALLVAALTEGGVTLLGGVKLTDAQVLHCTRPAWARTIASIQGTEFNEQLRIWDTRNPHFTMKHLYVCLSRAKGAANLHVT